MTQGKLGILKVAKIKSVEKLTPQNSRMPVKKFELSIPEIAAKAKPGQFVMMWLYDIDEKPMGIAGVKGNIVSFAVAKVGPATTAIHQLKEGELLGIRGPYGNSFSLKGENIAVMGGGTGIAPSKFLIDTALNKKLSVSLFHGARTKNELAYRKEFEKLEKENDKFKYFPSTDDGSFGFKGFSTECFESNLKQGFTCESLYACGPELMMHTAWKLAVKKSIYYEASLADRYFKCAIGLCGQCVVDPTGDRLCIDGPIFNASQLEKIEDFGKYTRDKYGQKHPISE